MPVPGWVDSFNDDLNLAENNAVLKVSSCRQVSIFMPETASLLPSPSPSSPSPRLEGRLEQLEEKLELNGNKEVGVGTQRKASYRPPDPLAPLPLLIFDMINA